MTNSTVCGITFSIFEGFPPAHDKISACGDHVSDFWRVSDWQLPKISLQWSRFQMLKGFPLPNDKQYSLRWSRFQFLNGFPPAPDRRIQISAITFPIFEGFNSKFVLNFQFWRVFPQHMIEKRQIAAITFPIFEGSTFSKWQKISLQWSRFHCLKGLKWRKIQFAVIAFSIFEGFSPSTWQKNTDFGDPGPDFWRVSPCKWPDISSRWSRFQFLKGFPPANDRVSARGDLVSTVLKGLPLANDKISACCDPVSSVWRVFPLANGEKYSLRWSRF